MLSWKNFSIKRNMTSFSRVRRKICRLTLKKYSSNFDSDTTSIFFVQIKLLTPRGFNECTRESLLRLPIQTVQCTTSRRRGLGQKFAKWGSSHCCKIFDNPEIANRPFCYLSLWNCEFGSLDLRKQLDHVTVWQLSFITPQDRSGFSGGGVQLSTTTDSRASLSTWLSAPCLFANVT